MTLLVRDVRPTEHDATGELLVATYRDHASERYLPVLRDVAGRTGAADTAVLVAVQDGAVVGTATYVGPGSVWQESSRPGEAGMRMLGVAESARGRGVGAALVAECVARARSAGATELVFGTLDTMDAAQRLYLRLGFERLPDRDEVLPSGRPLRVFGQALKPWPLVRIAREDDHAEVGELTADAYRADGMLDDAPDYADELRDAARRAKEAELLVAADRETGAVLGTVTLCPAGSPYGEVATADEAELRMLAVSPAARGQGAGEALVRAAMVRAHGRGARGIVLSTQRGMAAAHRIYERLGFQRVPDRDWEPVPGLDLLAYAREL